ncbi:MAG: NTP transferase domain-containing protein [Candidatus Heteroscillospira sp.]
MTISAILLCLPGCGERINGFCISEIAAQALTDGGAVSPAAVRGSGCPQLSGFPPAGWKNIQEKESLRAWLRALPRCDAFFMLTTDYPAVSPKTLRALAAGLENSQADCALPVINGKPGFPALIRAQSAHRLSGTDALLSPAELDRQLTAVQIPVRDGGIFMRPDNPDTLKRLTSSCGISREICRGIFYALDSAPEVRSHGEAVADKAREMCRILNRHGFALDTELCCSSAMLHDVFMTEAQHDRRIQRFLAEKGYDAVARVAGTHRRFPENPSLGDERCIVALADRLVAGTASSTPDKHYAPMLERFAKGTQIGDEIRRDYLRCARLYKQYQELERQRR